MSQKRTSQIKEAWNKVHEAGNIAANAVERVDETLLAWTLAWDTYLTLEKVPNKTEFQIADTHNIYEVMCLAWEAYQKALLENRDACLFAFNASVALHYAMQKEKLN